MATLKQKFEDAAIELAEAKRKLAEAQAKFDALFKQIKRGSVSAPAGQTTDETVLPLNASEQIIAVLKSDVNKAFGYGEIELRCSEIPKNSIRALLYKLKGANKVQKAGRGKWKAMPAI